MKISSDDFKLLWSFLNFVPLLYTTGVHEDYLLSIFYVQTNSRNWNYENDNPIISYVLMCYWNQINEFVENESFTILYS